MNRVKNLYYWEEQDLNREVGTGYWGLTTNEEFANTKDNYRMATLKELYEYEDEGFHFIRVVEGAYTYIQLEYYDEWEEVVEYVGYVQIG